MRAPALVALPGPEHTSALRALAALLPPTGTFTDRRTAVSAEAGRR